MDVNIVEESNKILWNILLSDFMLLVRTRKHSGGTEPGGGRLSWAREGGGEVGGSDSLGCQCPDHCFSFDRFSVIMWLCFSVKYIFQKNRETSYMILVNIFYSNHKSFPQTLTYKETNWMIMWYSSIIANFVLTR